MGRLDTELRTSGRSVVWKYLELENILDGLEFLLVSVLKKYVSN